jgi:putative nucleotidyltransferase with HDIG domain
MNDLIEQLLHKAGDIPPLPEIAQKALEIIHDPDSDVKGLADVVAIDQGLSGLILRWANSAFFGLPQKVTAVDRGIAVIGLKTVRELILDSCLTAYMIKPVPGYGLRRGDLWRHSLGVAVGARIIGEEIGSAVDSEYYFAGLLCDIGKIAFEQNLRTTDTLTDKWMNGSFEDMERETYGIDHAELSAEMARRWNLPDSMVNMIRFHHQPRLAGEDCVGACALHVADAAMMMMGIGLGKDGLRYHLDMYAFELLKMDDKGLIHLFEKIIEQIKVAELFISGAIPSNEQ